MPSRPRPSAAPARTPLARLVAAVLSVVMTVVVALVAAPPASANLNNLVSADPSGVPADRFYADDALYATFTSDLGGGYVCVVAASATDPAAESCRTPAWGTPNRFVGIGTMVGQPVEAAPLPVGRWRLLASDVTGDRVGTRLSPVFEVVPCRGECDTGPANAALSEWKERAGVSGTTFAGVCATAKATIRISGALAGYQLAVYLGGGIGGILLGAAWGYINATETLTSEAVGWSVVEKLSCGAQQMMDDIYADPPDFAYVTVAQPVLPELPVTGDAALDRLAAAYRDAEGYGVASRVAFERYQGAMIDGDLAAAAVQADATARFTRDLVVALRRVEAYQPAVARTAEMGEVVSTPEQLAEWSSLRDRVATDGFTPEEVALLTEAGLTAEEVAAFEDTFEVGDVADVDPSTTMRAQMDRVTAELAATITAFDTFGRQLSVAAAELREAAQVPENTAPVASFDASATTGTAPLTVTLTSTSTDPEGDALTLTWDVAGTAASGGSVRHVFTEPGTYPVTLTASDGRLSSTARVEVVVTAAPVEPEEPQEPAGPLAARFTVSSAYDAASAAHGARVASVTSEATSTSYRATNLLTASGSWRSATGATTDQDVVVTLAGAGLDLVDRVVLTNVTGASAARRVEVAVSATGTRDADFATVATGELAAASAPTALTFEARTARHVRVRVLDNHGGTQYVQLGQVQVPTPGRDGGLVSSDAGRPATAVASSTQNGSNAVNPILRTAARWVSASGQATDQWLRVDLGGEGLHPVEKVVLRGANATADPRDVEVLVSPTGEPGTFTQVATATLARSNVAQEVTFPPVDARAVEVRLRTNHGASNVALNELRVLTTHGLSVADATGVGARVTSVSSESMAPVGAIDDDASTRWRSASGQATDQHLTVLLRDGEVHDVDRVTVQSSAYRPRNVEVLVSTTGQDDDFTRVATAELPDTSDGHELVFPPVAARYVKLRLVDSWSTSYVAVNALRVHSPARGARTDVPFVDLSTGGAVAWHWDLGDGTTSDARHPVHTYAAPGRYDVTLTVTDAAGATATATRPYVVPEVPAVEVVPTAGATTVDEKASVALQARSSAPGVVVRWAWDLGYTTSTSTSSTLTAQFPDDGTYVVTARARTADGLWVDAAPVTFTVRNVAPTVDAGVGVTALAGDPLTPLSSVTDPADRPVCVWSWGDGTPDTTIASCTSGASRAAHTYAAPGTYTATLTADDGDGGVSSDTVELTVTHRPALLQVVTATPEGPDLRARVRLMDSPTTDPVGGQEVTVAAGDATVTATSDADGYADVLLPGAARAEDLEVTFAGSALHAPASLTRAVRLPLADIVFMIDESGSMGGAQSAVRQRVQEISRGLAPHLDFRLGLVGFGGHVAQDQAHVHTPLTHDLPVLRQQLADLRQNGGRENGFEATTLAMGDTMGFRQNAATCAVLVADEPATPNITTAGPQTKDDALAALRSRGATFFGVIATDAASVADYGVPDGLAGLTGGRSWTMSEFTRDASSVLAALVEHCVTAARTPDLAVVVDAGDTLEPDTAATATLTVTNEGAIDVTGVVLAHTLPAGVTFVEASHGGVLDAATGVVTWAVGDLAAGAQAQRTVTFRTPLAQVLGTGDHPLTHTATVRDDGAQGPERDLADNEHSATAYVRVTHVPVTAPVLTQEVVGTQDLGDGRRRVTFALDVTNPDAFFAAPYALDGTPLRVPAGVVVDGRATLAVDPAAPGTPEPQVTSYDMTTDVTVAQGTLAPGATHRYLATVVVVLDPERDHVPTTCGTASGVVLAHTATLTWDGTTTSADACAVVQPDPRRHGVGVTSRHDAPDGVTAGGELTWTLTVTNHGTVTARDVTVAPEVPARFEVVDVDAGGWDHDPTGRAATLRVTGGTLAPGASHDVVVRARLLPLPTPVVVEDEGPLDADLPAPVAAPQDDATLAACVTTTRDDDPADDCVTQDVALRDVVAAVTVRLSGGAPYLLVSTRTTRALAGAGVELTWEPLDAAGDVAAAEPGRVGPQVLGRDDLHVLTWPGVTVTDGTVVDWPGWRTADDGRGLVLDADEPDHAWRALSRLTFTAADAVTGAVVRYREVVDPGVDEPGEPGGEEPGEPGGEEPGEPGVDEPGVDEPGEPGVDQPGTPASPSDAGEVPAAQDGERADVASADGASPQAAGERLAVTGATWLTAGAVAVLAMLTLGAAMLWHAAERRRRDEEDGLDALTGPPA